MKALAKLKPETGIWMTDAPIPTIGPNDVLIKILKTAICGTDIHIFNWDNWAQKHVPISLIIGHEFVGEIVELGAEVKNYQIGDRVSGEGHIACGFCRNCRAARPHICRKNESVGVTRAGSFAEYISIPAVNAYPIPDSIQDNFAAVLDPFGNATHTTLSFDLVGEDVIITGAGPVGLFAVAVAKYAGARHVVIIDINDYRLNIAKQMGATLTLNANKDCIKEAMQQLKMREGFDIGLEMSGNPAAFNHMLNNMNHAGKIGLLGFLPNDTTIEWNQVIMKGLQIKGIYGREMFETWYKMINMLEHGLDISPVVTHEFPIDDYEKAFQVMASGLSGKVILSWV